jgi:hypothetical protein
MFNTRPARRVRGSHNNNTSSAAVTERGRPNNGNLSCLAVKSPSKQGEHACDADQQSAGAEPPGTAGNVIVRTTAEVSVPIVPARIQIIVAVGCVGYVVLATVVCLIVTMVRHVVVVVRLVVVVVDVVVMLVCVVVCLVCVVVRVVIILMWFVGVVRPVDVTVVAARLVNDVVARLVYVTVERRPGVVAALYPAYVMAPPLPFSAFCAPLLFPACLVVARHGRQLPSFLSAAADTACRGSYHHHVRVGAALRTRF